MDEPEEMQKQGPVVVAHLDCASGISGDMLLGALVHAGLPLTRLKSELRKLGLPGYRLSARTVRRAGVEATKVEVRVSGPQPVRQWSDARRIISSSSLPLAIKQDALRIMKNLFLAEGEVHGRPWSRVHLHELGAVDCLVDVVGAVAGLQYFGVKHLSCSQVNTGSGHVRTEHGTLPVPAPATAALLKGVPVYASGPAQELTTPTGAAILSTLSHSFGPLPEMTLLRIGVGAGTRDPESQPNVLRLFIGSRPVLSRTESVVVLETNIDDMEPRIFEHAMNLLLEAGALDVYLTPLIMKKSRPAVRMSVISTPESVSDLQSILLKETTTFGVRAYETSRRILERRWVRVETPYGRVRTKLGLLEGRVVQRMPEYEDCRRAALRHKVPLKRVLRAAEKASRGVV